MCQVWDIDVYAELPVNPNDARALEGTAISDGIVWEDGQGTILTFSRPGGCYRDVLEETERDIEQSFPTARITGATHVDI